MTRQIIISSRAQRDVDRIFTWIQKRSPSGAKAWYQAYSHALKDILSNPLRFSMLSEAKSRWLRELRQAIFKTPHGNRYRVVFESISMGIVVLRVRGPGQPPLRKRDLP